MADSSTCVRVGSIGLLSSRSIVYVLPSATTVSLHRSFFFRLGLLRGSLPPFLLSLHSLDDGDLFPWSVAFRPLGSDALGDGDLCFLRSRLL
jgi:hypothetical protein